MALTPDFVDQHVDIWQTSLRGSFRSYREKWPSRLFHHGPVENIVEVLRSGVLLSRRDSEAVRPLDVAGRDVIHLRDNAHAFARLYFRPKTPTQYRIEGIRKTDEYYNGQASAHAPVFVMMVFDARTILTTPGVRFSDGNMQSHDTLDGDTEEFFRTIPFGKVFHEGSTYGDPTITTHRCAEVLATSPLHLEGALQWVFCRSQAERQTLLHLLGEQADFWRGRIQVSEDIHVFQREFVYVEEVTLVENGVVFKLHPRVRDRPILVRVRAWDEDGRQVIEFPPTEMQAVPPEPNISRWRVPATLAPGTYLVQVDLEGCRAFFANVSLDEKPF